MRALSPVLFGIVALVTIGIGPWLLLSLAESLTLRWSGPTVAAR